MGSAGADLRGTWAVTPGEDWAWAFENHHPPGTQEPPAHLPARRGGRVKRPVFPWALPVCQPHTACPCSSDTQLFFFPRLRRWCSCAGPRRMARSVPGTAHLEVCREMTEGGRARMGFTFPSPLPPVINRCYVLLEPAEITGSLCSKRNGCSAAAAVPSCFLQVRYPANRSMEI